MRRFRTPLPARASRETWQLFGKIALGRTRFIAPAPQHPFFQVVNYGQLRAQVNGTIQVSSLTGA